MDGPVRRRRCYDPVVPGRQSSMSAPSATRVGQWWPNLSGAAILPRLRDRFFGRHDRGRGTAETGREQRIQIKRRLSSKIFLASALVIVVLWTVSAPWAVSCP